LANCYGRPIRKNSVLEVLSVKRLAVIQEDICLRKMLKLSDVGVENKWLEREIKLCIVSIKMVVQGK